MKTQHSLLALLALVLCSSLALGQTYHLLQTVVGAGGTTSSSSSYTTTNLLGQPVVGTSSSSNYQQTSGFWNEYEALQNYYATTYSMANGWNLISVPQTVGDYSKSVVFPNAASSAFKYDGGYKEESVLENGHGYWLKFPSSQNVDIIGIVKTTDTISLKNKDRKSVV